MKTFILSLCLLILSVFTVSAQDLVSHTSDIRVQFGGGFPTGAFKSKDFEEDYPPFAMPGHMLQVSYLQSIKRQLYAGATLAWRRNAFNLDKFADPTDTLVTSKTSEPWKSVFLMVDAEYRFLTGADFFYFVKGSLGAGYNRSASLNINTIFGPINREPANSFAFVYGLHSGMQVNMRGYGLGFEAGVLSTRPTFEITGNQSRTTKYKQPMTTTNLGVFASYSF